MTLDIIVPHYKEPWETCKYLFDSIALQRGINFSDIRVIVVNDGDISGCNLTLADTEKMQKYPFSVEFCPIVHGGVSAARNYGLDHSTADYVMFCDIDDGFLSNYGLHLVFCAMQEGFDYLYSNFVEETYADNGVMTIVPHEQDHTFMHGKVYRRQFLVDKNLRFDPSMTLHEDGYFNSLACVTALQEGKQKYINTPFYLWRWNDNSTVRKNREDFVLRTYNDVMATRIGICKQFQERGYAEAFETSVCMTVLNSYYDFQKPSYHLPRNEKHRINAERAFKRFYYQFGDVFRNTTNVRIAEIAQAARANACKNGMLMEREDLKTFLRHIEREVK